MNASVSTQEKSLYFTERGSGPALLLVHGLMVTGEMFEDVPFSKSNPTKGFLRIYISIESIFSAHEQMELRVI